MLFFFCVIWWLKHFNASASFRHCKVPVDELLGLAQLSHLKHLVILDPTIGPDSALLDLTQKLYIQTNYRINVINLIGPKYPNACLCVNNWVSAYAAYLYRELMLLDEALFFFSLNMFFLCNDGIQWSYTKASMEYDIAVFLINSSCSRIC